MIWSALFLQRALYTVYRANILHSRKPSFIISPPFLVNTVNRYLLIYAAIKYAAFLLKQFHLIAFDINTVKHPWFIPHVHEETELCSSADPKVWKRFRSHSRALEARFFIMLFWRHGVELDCDVLVDVPNGWGECILPIRLEIYFWNVRFDWRLI